MSVPAKCLRTLPGVGVKPSITQLLAVLGMQYRTPPKKKYRFGEIRHRGFWDREEERLPYILHDAHKAYIALARTIRPDLTENHLEAVKLTSAWRDVRKHFARHGVTL